MLQLKTIENVVAKFECPDYTFRVTTLREEIEKWENSSSSDKENRLERLKVIQDNTTNSHWPKGQSDDAVDIDIPVDQVIVDIRVRSVDNFDPSKTVIVAFYMRCAPYRTKKKLVNELVRQVACWQLHEIGEQIRYEGELIVSPHDSEQWNRLYNSTFDAVPLFGQK